MEDVPIRLLVEPRHEISNNMACAANKASDQPVQMHSLIRASAYRFSVILMLSYRPNIIWSFLALKEAALARLSLHL